MQKYVLIGMLGLLLLGCSDSDPSEIQAVLNQAKNQWSEQGGDSYRYTARWNCFCPEDYVAAVDVEVIDNAVNSVRFAEATRTGEVPDPERFRPIEGMFEYVQAAIDAKAAGINAAYDPARGYPQSVFIDQDERIADEEFGFSISSWQAQ